MNLRTFFSLLLSGLKNIEIFCLLSRIFVKVFKNYFDKVCFVFIDFSVHFEIQGFFFLFISVLVNSLIGAFLCITPAMFL